MFATAKSADLRSYDDDARHFCKVAGAPLRLGSECDRSASAAAGRSTAVPWRLTSFNDAWQTPRSGVSRSVRVDPAGSFVRRDANGKKSNDDVSR
jgi:hypothetical protein